MSKGSEKIEMKSLCRGKTFEIWGHRDEGSNPGTLDHRSKTLPTTPWGTKDFSAKNLGTYIYLKVIYFRI